VKYCNVGSFSIWAGLLLSGVVMHLVTLFQFEVNLTEEVLRAHDCAKYVKYLKLLKAMNGRETQLCVVILSFIILCIALLAELIICANYFFSLLYVPLMYVFLVVFVRAWLYSKLQDVSKIIAKKRNEGAQQLVLPHPSNL
jgi:hypothetical protein